MRGSEYTQIPVSVCLCRGGPRRKRCLCVRGCQVGLQHLHCDVSHLITDTRFLLPLPCAANMRGCGARACDRQTSAEVWRLVTAPRPLMTPSILSPVTRADYPQRHLLTLYANESETGSNEKRVTDKKINNNNNKRVKRNRRKATGNSA